MISSCKKEVIEKTNTKNVPTTASVEAAAADKTYANSLIYKTILIAFGAGVGDINAFKADESYVGCANITIDSSSFPNHVTIDFGSSGCTLSDGTPVTGVITGTYTHQNLGTPGSTAMLDMSGLYINGDNVLGSFNIHNKGMKTNGDYSFDIVLTGGNIVFGSDGHQFKQEVNWLVEWLRNGNTDKNDDFFRFTGITTGETSDGDAYTENITEPLNISRAPGCVRQFVSGVSVLNIAGQPDMTIDYGDGTCDRRAEVTQGGVRTRIELATY